MPWNEPGDPSNKKDPWTGRPKQTPPDLEAFLRDLRKKIVTLFKLKSLNKKHTPLANFLLSAQFNTNVIGLVTLLFLITWLASGFFTIAPTEQAVTTRFGHYNKTLAPGYHWILRPIEHLYIINTENFSHLPMTVDLLTQDENKISIGVNVDYHIVNARHYLFSTEHPLLNLKEAITSTINHTLGSFSLEQLLTTPPFLLQPHLQNQLNNLMEKYHTGLAINHIELQPIQVPDSLKTSFQKAVTAQADKKQLENQAKIYAAQVEPTAKNQAQHLIREAKAYQQAVILNAKIATTRFLALLPAYQAAPLLTRKRLYLETLETMMAHSNKLFIENTANTTLSLILDQSMMPNNKQFQESEGSSLQAPIADKIHPSTPPSLKTNNLIPRSDVGGYE